MPDVRTWWPNITNSELDILRIYSHYEWLIMKRLVGNIGGGKEISEDDLAQGVPSDKLGKLKGAIRTLEKKKVIRIKPKPGMRICQVEPSIYTETVVKFAEIIRSDKNLVNSLLSEDVLFINRSEIISKIINNTFGKKADVLRSIRVSDKCSVLDDGLGIVITLAFHCPEIETSMEHEFEILDPRDLTSKIEHWSCECGRVHMCFANGNLF